MSRRAATLGLIALLGFGTTACAADPGTPSALPPQLESIRPTMSPPAGSSAAPAPAGFREVTGEHFSIAVPPGWEDAEPGRSGMAAVVKPAGVEKTLLGVVVDDKPDSGVIEQSKVTEVGLRSKGGTQVTRSEVEWPGARRAVMMDWRQKVGGPEGDELRYRQLFLEVNDTLLVTVVGAAPTAAFDDSGIVAAIETFRATA